MDWKVLAALGFLGLALIAGFVICIATSVTMIFETLSLNAPRNCVVRNDFNPGVCRVVR